VNTIKGKQLPKYRDYFWFILFRNPFDRLLSAYSDKALAEVGDQRYMGMFDPHSTIEEFLEKHVFSKPDEHCDLHVRSQTRGIEKHINGMNFIGTVEKFDKSMKIICDNLGLKYKRLKLRETKKKVFPEHLKDRVRERYKNDIEIFKQLNLYKEEDL
jgi:hypothetical protein